MECGQPGSIELENLTAKESVVLSLDEDTLGQLPPEQRKWVEQIKRFLERYMHVCSVYSLYKVHVHVRVFSCWLKCVHVHVLSVHCF